MNFYFNSTITPELILILISFPSFRVVFLGIAVIIFLIAFFTIGISRINTEVANLRSMSMKNKPNRPITINLLAYYINTPTQSSWFISESIFGPVRLHGVMGDVFIHCVPTSVVIAGLLHYGYLVPSGVNHDLRNNVIVEVKPVLFHIKTTQYTITTSDYPVRFINSSVELRYMGDHTAQIL